MSTVPDEVIDHYIIRILQLAKKNHWDKDSSSNWDFFQVNIRNFAEKCAEHVDMHLLKNVCGEIRASEGSGTNIRYGTSSHWFGFLITTNEVSWHTFVKSFDDVDEAIDWFCAQVYRKQLMRTFISDERIKMASMMGKERLTFIANEPGLSRNVTGTLKLIERLKEHVASIPNVTFHVWWDDKFDKGIYITCVKN